MGGLETAEDDLDLAARGVLADAIPQPADYVQRPGRTIGLQIREMAKRQPDARRAREAGPLGNDADHRGR